MEDNATWHEFDKDFLIANSGFVPFGETSISPDDFVRVLVSVADYYPGTHRKGLSSSMTLTKWISAETHYRLVRRFGAFHPVKLFPTTHDEYLCERKKTLRAVIKRGVEYIDNQSKRGVESLFDDEGCTAPQHLDSSLFCCLTSYIE